MNEQRTPDKRLIAAATEILRFRPGDPQGWLAFDGTDDEWDDLRDAAWKELAAALEEIKAVES